MADRGAPGRASSTLLALVLLLAGVVVVVPRPAAAGAGAGAAGTVAVAAAPAPTAPAAASALVLRSQTTWWQPDQPFSLALAVDAADPTTVEVAVSIHGLLRNRTAFAATVDGRTSGRAIQTATFPVAELPVDDAGNRVVTFTPNLRNDGVYPLRVELRPLGGGPAVASLVTHVVAVPPTLEGDRLSVATIVPVHAPPATAPDGSRALGAPRVQQLGELAEGLGRQPDVAITFAPTPETIDALAAGKGDDEVETLAALAAAARGRTVLGSPYVPTNLNSMIDAGLEDESTEQLTRGTDVLRKQLATEPSTDTRLIDERLSDGALAHLQTEQQVVRLVVPEALLEPIARDTTLTATFGMTSRRGPIAAAMADTALASHFAEASPVLAAQHLLADLAQIYNDDPTALKRGVVVTPARSWSPNAEFLAAFLTGLATSPVLAPIGIDAFFDAVEPAVVGTGSRATPLVRRVGPSPDSAPAAPELPGSAILAARQRLDTFAGALVPGDPVGAGILDALDRTLLVVPSVDLRVRDRARYLAGVTGGLDRQLEAVTMPPKRSITLTAREGDIPVTITSRLGYPLRVALRVSGSPVEFPGGDRHDLELQRANTTSRFGVRAPSSGSFPIRVRITFPASEDTIAESRFTVRSTAISGVGTALSFGAGLFLVVWWGNHLRGRRRSRRLVPA